MGFHIRAGQRVELQYGSSESEAVRIAIRNLAQDLGKVLPGVEVCLREEAGGGVTIGRADEFAGWTGFDGQGTAEVSSVIVIETLEEQRDARAYDPEQGNAEKDSTGNNSAEKDKTEKEFAGKDCAAQNGTEENWTGKDSAGKESTGENRAEKNFAAQSNGVKDLAEQDSVERGRAAENNAKHQNDIAQNCKAQGRTEQVIDRKQLTDENGLLRREAFQLRVQDGKLYIAGVGRRGTVYGIYTFCEWMGVSPWYFFADVPVRERRELTLEEGYCLTDWPSVEYRGIFINDEEELEAWVRNYMGEPTIGVKSYEKIFELLLRLKANYIWPAMHVNSFNLTPENGALADRMGIVVGTSHCDMLMRSNNREWKPWIRRKGYTDAVYDYSIEGRNRDILKEYWRESVEQNREYEVCYTLGMRGIHDSGFETKNLEGGTEEEIRRAKIELLGKIITDQREILRDTLGHETMMTFIPYKEVLELYDNGLKIPEDMTLVWANDNYGYIRRYPSGAEKRRKGGNGIYYHNSYWSPPSMSYVFLCSIPLAHTRNELQKAWDQGIRKLWVLNSGAMKPLEQEITFFLRLAWEIGKPGAVTEDVEAFAEDWIDRTFTGKIGKQVSGLLNDFSQLTNVRKLENMDYDAFSQTAYGDEAAMRIHRYEELFDKGNELYGKLPEEERDAFFQLVLMRIHAAYFTNLSYYYGDRSTLMFDRGNFQGAVFYTEKSREAEDSRRRLLHYYNHEMHGGKWNGILNPEGFPPPRAAMMPVCTPPLERWDGEILST
ncbi:MAG: glycosyl hydrolase 115 family protein, partial [Acetatifactor sp.]|nr:glycosyl hydrolase 115 family protein [Acetatifactor sp.]